MVRVSFIISLAVEDIKMYQLSYIEEMNGFAVRRKRRKLGL